MVYVGVQANIGVGLMVGMRFERQRPVSQRRH